MQRYHSTNVTVLLGVVLGIIDTGNTKANGNR